MNTAANQVPVPAGATEVSDWCDVGHPDEFRSFTGPSWPGPTPQYNSGNSNPMVIVYGTQLRDGTIEGRCIRVGGLHWDDELSSDQTRKLAAALLKAADALDHLDEQVTG